MTEMAVIAGTHQQFLSYQEQVRKDPEHPVYPYRNKLVYVHAPEVAHGRLFKDCVLTGTWYDVPNVRRLIEAVQARFEQKADRFGRIRNVTDDA